MIFNRWIALVLIGVMVLAACRSASSEANRASYASELRGAVFDPPRSLADFSLMSTRGENFTLSEHRGEIILLYFGYRACPDFCPTTFAELRRIYAELGEPADQLKVVFVTVDPERDTLENLSLYTHAFHEDFIGLRGEGESLQALMSQFGVVATRRQLDDSALSYLIDHTASLFLIGPDGRLAVQYLYGTDYRDIVHDVQLILRSV
jgi:protein SCO1/2